MVSTSPGSTAAPPAGAVIVIVGEALAGLTVIVEVPVTPPAVAEMTASPAATPVTSPVELTVATASSSLDHVTVPQALPDASSASAVSCCVPAMSIVAVAGVTVTVAVVHGP
jgi:hypothetical protein